MRSRAIASPEAIAHIMAQKFAMASPLYRQEQEWNRSGIQFSRQTMSNWILRASDDWLRPVYEEMHRRLVCEKVLSEFQKIYLEPESEESKRKRSGVTILALAEATGQAV